jgi:hypothetical protein
MSEPFTPSATVACILVPLITNIIWLPYLALRASALPGSSARSTPAVLVRIAQSPLLPAYALTVVLASVPYFLFAHASPALPAGDVGARFADLYALCKNDILASSFAVDCGAFALFQGYLVGDDASMRGWKGERATRAKAAARFVPFFGLVWYLFERAFDDGAHKL